MIVIGEITGWIVLLRCGTETSIGLIAVTRTSECDFKISCFVSKRVKSSVSLLPVGIILMDVCAATIVFVWYF